MRERVPDTSYTRSQKNFFSSVNATVTNCNFVSVTSCNNVTLVSKHKMIAHVEFSVSKYYFVGLRTKMMSTFNLLRSRLGRFNA